MCVCGGGGGRCGEGVKDIAYECVGQSCPKEQFHTQNLTQLWLNLADFNQRNDRLKTNIYHFII